MCIEKEITSIIEESVQGLGRADLYREPIVAFSSADDPRFEELKQIVGDWVRTPREFLESAQTVVSYFVPFAKDVAMAPKREEGASVVWGEAYLVINSLFSEINDRICEHLQQQGFEAAAVPATHTYDPCDMKSAWSHRSAAAIAGLGYFAANRMLVTEKGSAGRYCTVFTSAQTTSRREPPKNRCGHLRNGSCNLCFEACPIGALRPDGFDRFACQERLFENQDQIAALSGMEEADVCGKCLSVCPLAYLGS